MKLIKESVAIALLAITTPISALAAADAHQISELLTAYKELNYKVIYQDKSKTLLIDPTTSRLVSGASFHSFASIGLGADGQALGENTIGESGVIIYYCKSGEYETQGLSSLTMPNGILKISEKKNYSGKAIAANNTATKYAKSKCRSQSR